MCVRGRRRRCVRPRRERSGRLPAGRHDGLDRRERLLAELGHRGPGLVGVLDERRSLRAHRHLGLAGLRFGSARTGPDVQTHVLGHGNLWLLLRRPEPQHGRNGRRQRGSAATSSSTGASPTRAAAAATTAAATATADGNRAADCVELPGAGRARRGTALARRASDRDAGRTGSAAAASPEPHGGNEPGTVPAGSKPAAPAPPTNASTRPLRRTPDRRRCGEALHRPNSRRLASRPCGGPRLQPSRSGS